MRNLIITLILVTMGVPVFGQSPDPAKCSGLFVSDVEGFPFVFQVEVQGETVVVTGMGTVPYSATDSTRIATTFKGHGPADGHSAVRGALELQPDGNLLTQTEIIPWVGLFDTESGNWQTMFSPKHFAGTSRAGSVTEFAKKGKPKPDGDGIDVGNLLDRAFRASDLIESSGLEGALQLGRIYISAQQAADAIQSVIPPNVSSRLATVRDNLRANYTGMARDLGDFGTRMADAARGAQGSTAIPTTPTVNADPSAIPDPKDRPFDDVLRDLRAGGLTNDRLSLVLLPARDDAHAGRVASVTRLPTGMIEIVSYAGQTNDPAVMTPEPVTGLANTLPGSPHPLNGDWEFKDSTGLKLVFLFNINVVGSEYQLTMISTNPGDNTRATIFGSISGSGREFSGELTRTARGATDPMPFSIKLADDNRSLTMTSLGKTDTWYRK